MKLIMVIDDEIGPMRYYLMALKREFDVIQIPGPDEVSAYVDDPGKPMPVAVILDAMLSPGQKYLNNPAAEHGLRTGVLLYEEVLKVKWPEVSVLVLTNSEGAVIEL